MIANGESTLTVKDVLGHSSVVTTEWYYANTQVARAEGPRKAVQKARLVLYPRLLPSGGFPWLSVARGRRRGRVRFRASYAASVRLFPG